MLLLSYPAALTCVPVLQIASRSAFVAMQPAPSTLVLATQSQTRSLN